ncbi:hypothetical protein ATY78_15640 [Rhizobium sp. R635]|uniref:hypothetical protein n=1 Tax=unclassified Rhizobium TaxID=2613769 RepID=UPI000B52AEA8|nr:hypothetical protein [Rhizobium sp. R635]OWV91483.1 hypothetical protein ATY78_15640 [Rhizobium sp. R635]
MKHRRSIELQPPAGYAIEIERQTLATLPQWFVVHARCRACRHQTPIDRRDVTRRCGDELSLATLAKRLKCRGCGNRSGNLLLLGKLPRD